MFETIINEAVNVFRDTFLAGDVISMVIAFGSVLVASLLMRRGTQVGSMTLLALTIFAIGGIMRGYFRGAPPEGGSEGGRVVNQLESSWSSFMAMSAGSLVSYFVAFMALILILYGARAIFSRG